MPGRRTWTRLIGAVALLVSIDLRETVAQDKTSATGSNPYLAPGESDSDPQLKAAY